MIATCAEVMEDWSRIHDHDCPLVIDHRNCAVPELQIAPLLARAPFAACGEGDLPIALAALGDLPAALGEDIAGLARRFMDLMHVSAIRLRLDGVTTNACKKVHTDYADVRLITTYAGPGTDYLPYGAADNGGDCCLERVPTGAIALFKGRTYAPSHAPCLHRSPPIEGSDATRLVLVIDTPLRDMPPDAAFPCTRRARAVASPDA